MSGSIPLLSAENPPPPKSKPKWRKSAPAPGRPAPNPSNCGARGLPSASISPRSKAARFLSSPRISYAEPTSAKRSFALGSLLWSGWYFLASFRNADLMSEALAVFDTPRTSYGLRIMSPFFDDRLVEARPPMSPETIWDLGVRHARRRATPFPARRIEGLGKGRLYQQGAVVDPDHGIYT